MKYKDQIAFILVLAFLSVCMNSCTCACVSQRLYGLLCLRFSAFVWTLVLALVLESLSENQAFIVIIIVDCLQSAFPLRSVEY